MSMREIKAIGADITALKKQIELPAFSPPVVLSLHETTSQRLPPAVDITVPALVAYNSTVVQGARLLEPHSVSVVKFKVDEKPVPLRDLLLDSSDERFLPAIVDWYQVVTDGRWFRAAGRQRD